MPTKEQFLQRAKDYAISQKGSCLATEYISTKTKTQWKCHNPEHPIFETDFQIIKRGSWCVLCGIEKNAKKSTLSNGLELAKARALKEGGECLSTEYKNARTKMLWDCKKPGHKTWLADFDHVVTRGRWCKQCGYEKALSKGFDKLAEEYAANKGGRCILPEDRKVKTATEITWICENPKHPDHTTWKATFRNVVTQGGWCPYCAGRFTKEEYLQMANKFANDKNKNWTCISQKYVGQSYQLLWNCKEHGDWFESYSSLVDKNGGCKKCRGILTPEEYLEKAKAYAISQGGECVSSEYVTQDAKLVWKCHTHGNWESDYGNIVINNRWCPACFREAQKAKMLEKAHEQAKKFDGECLTTTFDTQHDLFDWKCNNELHPKWSSKYNTVLGNKSWCPECGIYYQKENQNRKLLEYLLGFSLAKAKPKWNVNPKTGNLLELDGYNKDKKIAFEYQGRQHYQDNVFKNQNQSLDIIQFKDKIKAQHCIDKEITLLIIDGRKKRDTSKRMVIFLKELLESYNLDYRKDIDFDEVEKIYNAARIEKCDNTKKI